MARKASSKPDSGSSSTATIGFEAKLWLTADKLRNNMDAAEYKHVVLGLIFLKYISDTFEEHRAKLLAGEGDYAGTNPENPDEPSGARQPAVGSPKVQRVGAEQYKAENVFWVPADARWSHLQASAKQLTIGKTVDDAMVAIERDNPRLKGVLPKDYARPGLDKQRLGELIDLIATISLTAASEGEKTHRSVDLLGRVYDWSGATKTAAGSPKGERGGAHQYFLTRFASAEGKNGGQPSGARQTAKGSPQGERGGVHQFYTPSCVVRCLVEMLAPYTALRGSAFLQSEASSQVVSAAKDKGRIYDPACGSGGNPRHSERRSEAETASRRLPAGRAQRGNFVEFHGGPDQRDSASSKREATHPGLKGNRGDISIYGQDKWVLSPRPFGLATRARRVRNGQGSESFWIAAAAGWEALMRAGSMRRFVHLKVISP